MRAWALVALATMLATEASALSCLRPDAARSFNAAAHATEVYHVYLGELTLTETLPNGGSTKATFHGQGLLKHGFSPISDREFTLVSRCAAEWCGSIAPRTTALFFARVTDSGTVVDVAPCENWIFVDPTVETVKTIESCMRGEPCEEGPLFR